MRATGSLGGIITQRDNPIGLRVPLWVAFDRIEIIREPRFPKLVHELVTLVPRNIGKGRVHCNRTEIEVSPLVEVEL